MTDKNFIKIMQRIVGQVKFRPTLSSWQNTVEVAKDFEGSFEHWQIEKRQDVTLHSPKERKLLQILYNSILYLNEKSENTEELKSYIKKSYSANGSEVEKFDHLGVRNIQLIGVKFKFEELVEMLYKKIYRSEILSISSDTVNDVSFSINATKDGIRNNVMLGPVTQEEGLQRFSSIFGVDDYLLELSKYESFIFIDVDTFIKNQGDIDLIDALTEKNKEIIEQYIDYIR